DCAGTHCDILPARLITPGESCAAQIFDHSQTVHYTQLAIGARDFDRFPFATIFPVFAFDGRLDGSYSADDPGVNAVPNPCAQAPALAPLPPSRGAYFDFLTEPPTGGGTPLNLLYWNPVDTNGNGLDATDVVWVAVVPGEELRIDNKTGSGNVVAADGSANRIEGGLIDETGASGNIHFHPDFDLRVNGGGLPSTGVYLVKLNITMPGFSEGSPVYVAFATIGTPTNAQRVAIEQVDSQLVLPLCDDGIDNDQDGLTDFAGGDPGCSSASDDSEKSTAYECDDGIDNDGDGLIDYRADPFGAANLYAGRDPECDSQGAVGVSEAPEPGASAMLIAGVTLLSVLRRRRSRATAHPS
ncbi:PEP-CTERM sorting domain-containing protein, partial [Myxococcota bacterium]|nr:PEP-CTERM sorting domain-containing protein [Myxococcota bacterium]